MVVNENSIEDAILKGQNVLGREKSHREIHAQKQPSGKSWDLAEKDGQYLTGVNNANKEEASNPENKDGCIEVVSGRARVSDPIGDGRYASINPCDPNVDVYINGDRIANTTIVTEKDRIEFRVHNDEDGTASIKVELAEDRMKAVLVINKFPGRHYYVKDAQKTSLLNVSSGFKETPAPDVTLAQCLQELKKAGVDLKFVKGTTVNMLVGQRYGGSAVVAEGVYPVDGRDSVVEYMFQNSEYRNPEFDTDKKVDLLDHTIMPTVKVGEVLAKKVFFALPGRDGQTVTGETVKARQGKDIPLKAGEGAVLMDNDTRIVATANGRPMFKNGVVMVVPLLVIPHNVDPGTGNIYFDGDIRIKGSVMDNMKVTAEGDITVLGNVLQASMFAGGSVSIVGNIISSRVYAGKGVANKLCVLPKIQQIHSTIKADFYDDNSEIQINVYKNMRQRFSSMFEERAKKLETLIKDIKAMLGLVSDQEADSIQGILKGVDRVYGRGGIGISTEQIGKLNEEIQKYLQEVGDSNRKKADLRFGYAQTSSVQAYGNVLITGRGAYQTDIIAKDAIIFAKASSVVLGGMLIAGKRIDMGIVGSPGGISTYCKVIEEEGKISAIRFFGNTVLNKNNKKQVIK